MHSRQITQVARGRVICNREESERTLTHLDINNWLVKSHLAVAHGVTLICLTEDANLNDNHRIAGKVDRVGTMIPSVGCTECQFLEC